MSRAGFGLLFGLIATVRMDAQPIGEAAAPLAARIFSLLPRRVTVSLEFQTLTPLATVESSSFRSALQDELRKAGVEIAAATQPDSRLRVTLSENARGLLFVAEFSTRDARQVAMLPWNAPATGEAKSRVKFVQKPVWVQAELILDFVMFDSDTQLLVLSATKLSGYRLAGSKWTLTGESSWNASRPVVRDPRGRLQVSGGALRVFLPGTACSSPLLPSLRLACVAGSDAWPLNPRDSAFLVRWVVDRNLLVADGVRGTFYNAAAGLLAGADGRILDRSNEPVPGADGWGSDLTAIDDPCGTNTLVVASLAGDSQAHDQIQAYQIMNGQATARGDALPLAGPVTALWPAEAAGQATLVVRNSTTGNYEASRLGLACAE